MVWGFLQLLVGKASAYFSSRVVVTETGCWEWQGARDPKGYGRLKIGGRATGRCYTAHRYAWILEYGEPGDLCVLHRCDNAPCCNPEHLHLGTRADNNTEMRERGRAFLRVPYERHGEIKRRHAGGETQTAIAREFGVDRSTIGLIVRRAGGVS